MATNRGKFNSTPQYLVIQKEKWREELAVSRSAHARFLSMEYPEIFPTAEDARQSLKYYDNAKGSKIKLSEETRNSRTTKHYTYADYLNKINSYKEAKRPPYFFTHESKAILMSDIHFPIECKRTIELAIERGIKIDANVIFLNGDIVDFTRAGRFTVLDPKRPSIHEELQMAYDFLCLLRKTFPDAKIIYKYGNHEKRLNHAILQQASFLSSIPTLALDKLLYFEELNITHLINEPAVLGELHIYHGDELLKNTSGSTVNPARGIRMKIANDIMFGHVHRPSHDIVYGAVSRKGIRASHLVQSLGCMSDTSPEWNPTADQYPGWTKGFAELYWTPDVPYESVNYKVDDYGKLKVAYQR